MLKNCDDHFNLVSSEIKCTATKKHKILTGNTKPHRSNQKQTARSFGKYEQWQPCSVHCKLQDNAGIPLTRTWHESLAWV